MDVLLTLFKEVFYLSAMASVLVLLLLVLKKVFHKTLSPKWHYYLWVVLILRLLVPLQPPSALSIYTVFYNAAESANLPIAAAVEPFQHTPPAHGNTISDTGINNTADHPAGLAGAQTQNVAAGGPIQNSGAAHPEKQPFDLIKAAAFVWLGGMLLLGLYTLGINIAFAADVRKRYKPLRSARIERLLGSCKEALHITQTMPLLTADKARAPALYGLLRPKILISEISMNQLGDSEISHVFLHELSHYKRRDIAVNWLLTVLQIVYFFNPLIWYAFHKIREDCEIACDAAALGYLKPDERQSYGGTVIKLIRLVSESSFIPVTAGMAKNKSSIKRRIRMIGSFKKSKWTGTLLAIILLAAVALIGLTGCSTKTNDAAQNTPPASNAPASNATASNAPPSDSAPQDTASGSPSADTSPDVSATPSTGDNNILTPDVSASPGPSEAPKPALSAGPTAAPAPTSSTAPMATPKPTAAAEVSPSVSTVSLTYFWYLTKWEVDDVLAYGKAGTYSKADAEKLIGKTLSFSKAEATIINDQSDSSPAVYKNPKFEEGVISSGDFLTNYGVSFAKLGITTDYVPKVDVSVPDAGGCTLLLRNDGILILIAGGTYFKLVLAK